MYDFIIDAETATQHFPLEVNKIVDEFKNFNNGKYCNITSGDLEWKVHTRVSSEYVILKPEAIPLDQRISALLVANKNLLQFTARIDIPDEIMGFYTMEKLMGKIS